MSNQTKTDETPGCELAEAGGICLNCSHEHTGAKYCLRNMVIGHKRVCFGPNPHTETYYGDCLCDEFASMKTALDPLQLLNALYKNLSNEMENESGRFLPLAKAQSKIFHVTYYLENGKLLK